MCKKFFLWLKSLFVKSPVVSVKSREKTSSSSYSEAKKRAEVKQAKTAYKLEPVYHQPRSDSQSYPRQTQSTITSTHINNEYDGFMDSAIIADMTDNVALGAVLGGSITGAIVGEVLFGKDNSREESYSAQVYETPTPVYEAPTPVYEIPSYSSSSWGGSSSDNSSSWSSSSSSDSNSSSSYSSSSSSD
jgi:hypothetical protein